MKVDVITADRVEFGVLRWWSNWIDIAVFEYAQHGYLLQMKISRTNAKSFKAVPMKSILGIAHPSAHEIGELGQMEEK